MTRIGKRPGGKYRPNENGTLWVQLIPCGKSHHVSIEIKQTPLNSCNVFAGYVRNTSPEFKSEKLKR